MKTTILSMLLLSGVSFAGFEKWTNKAGKAADLELVKVIESSGEKVGEFKTKNGKTVTLKASELAEADAKRLADFKPAAAAADAAPAGAATPSVYDDILDGNLVKLSGKSLKKCSDATKPAKYYLFYHTASWCGPCQAFTPSLVAFYDEYKPKGNDFELVLITHDSDEKAMEGYALEKKMMWPQLKMAKVEKFSKEFKHPGTGIPNLVLTDLQGNILKASYEGTEYKGPGVVMEHLKSLLK